MKKGFTLVELLVSIILLAIVMTFFTSLIMDLKNKEQNLDININLMVNRVAITKAINYDIIESNKRIRDIECEASGLKCTLNFEDGSYKYIEIFSENRSLKYYDDLQTYLVRTLSKNTFSGMVYTKNKLESSGTIMKLEIGITDNDKYNIEIYDFLKRTGPGEATTIVYDCNAADPDAGENASIVTVISTFSGTTVLSENTCWSPEAGTDTTGGMVYTPSGWNTKADGTGEHFDFGSLATNLEEKIQDNGILYLYAEWPQQKQPFFSRSNTLTYQVIVDGKGDWRLKIKSAGDITTSLSAKLDLFLVGGGGGGGGEISWAGGGGGGGGYTETYLKTLIPQSTYTIDIGLGGQGGSDGDINNNTSATNGKAGGTTKLYSNNNIYYEALGGGGGSKAQYIDRGWAGNGGSGGSGGGGGGDNSSARNGGDGGSYGSDGECTKDGATCRYQSQGLGQKTTTCEFGEGTVEQCFYGDDYAYSGGGGGGAGAGGENNFEVGSYGTNGKGTGVNSGGGGKGKLDGYSGIVILRNVR